MTPHDLITLSTIAAQAHARFTYEFRRMFPVNRPVRSRDGEIGVRPTLTRSGENYVHVQVQTVHGPMTFGVHELTPASWRQVPAMLRPLVVRKLAGPKGRLP